jgi:hypothetical protein
MRGGRGASFLQAIEQVDQCPKGEYWRPRSLGCCVYAHATVVAHDGGIPQYPTQIVDSNPTGVTPPPGVSIGLEKRNLFGEAERIAPRAGSASTRPKRALVPLVGGYRGGSGAIGGADLRDSRRERIVAGLTHSCALLEGRGVDCWATTTAVRGRGVRLHQQFHRCRGHRNRQRQRNRHRVRPLVCGATGRQRRLLG